MFAPNKVCFPPNTITHSSKAVSTTYTACSEDSEAEKALRQVIASKLREEVHADLEIKAISDLNPATNHLRELIIG